MPERDHLVDELRRAIEGDPWHGASVMAILRDVTAAMASRRPHGAVHSIWDIVRHVTAWTNEVSRRLDGHPPAEPQEGDWPQPSGDSAEAWSSDVERLLDAHRGLVEKVSTLSDGTLHAPPQEHRNAPEGSGVTHYVLLHGLAQHHAYHGGQIALLKKMVADHRNSR